MAFVQLSVCGLEGVVVEEISVVNRDDFSRASGGEMDAGFAVGDDGVVGVDESAGDVGNVVPIGCEWLGFGG